MIYFLELFEFNFTVITPYCIISYINTSNIKSTNWNLVYTSSNHFDFINVAILIPIYFLFFVSLNF